MITQEQEKPVFEEDDDFPEWAASQDIPHFFLTPNESGDRLDKVLAKRMPQFSRSRIQQWIDGGFVTVNGLHLKGKYTVFGDEEVIVHPQAAPEESCFQPEKITLPIIFEDDAIIIINKPAGVVVHPAAGNWSGTLLNGLLYHYPALTAVPRAGIVHRLDKNTSGIMVVAKTLQAHTNLVRQLQQRSITREYLALVWGIPSLQKTITGAIGRHPKDRIKMAVLENQNAKPAVTHYRRLVTGKLGGLDVSLLLCSLETGRTHQIRVHMQSTGFSIVGDTVYGKPHLAAYFPRQALHARKLRFVHPDTGEEREWSADLPDDMRQLFFEAGINENEK